MNILYRRKPWRVRSFYAPLRNWRFYGGQRSLFGTNFLVENDDVIEDNDLADFLDCRKEWNTERSNERVLEKRGKI